MVQVSLVRDCTFGSLRWLVRLGPCGGRYIGAFLTVIILCLFMALSAGARDQSAEAVLKTLGPVALMMLVLGSTPRAYSILRDLVRGEETVNAPVEALAATRALGLRPATRWQRPHLQMSALHPGRGWLACKSWPKSGEGEWKGELLGPHFCGEDAAFTAVARSGAIAIVSASKPQCRSQVEWSRLGNTDYYVHLLPDFHARAVGESIGLAK